MIEKLRYIGGTHASVAVKFFECEGNFNVISMYVLFGEIKLFMIQVVVNQKAQ